MTYSNRHFGKVEDIGKYDSQEPLLSSLNTGMPHSRHDLDGVAESKTIVLNRFGAQNSLVSPWGVKSSVLTCVF